jgi:hypothetical protein
MMNFKTLLVLLAMVAATQAQADTDYLTDPVYAPFINIVIQKAGICLADPAISSGEFRVPNCPGLVSILNDLYNNVTDPKITCEPACVSIFNKLGDECSTALRDAFTGTDPVGKAGSAFYDACDDVSPATAPEAAPTTASPSPSPASASPMPSPTPTPAAPSSAAVKSIPQVSLLAADILFRLSILLVISTNNLIIDAGFLRCCGRCCRHICLVKCFGPRLISIAISSKFTTY